MPTVHSRGFTLVELLVVFVIIAVLVVILLPALQSAREIARKALCQSQMRQVGILTHNYYNDFGVILPGAYFTHYNSGGQAITTPGVRTLYTYYDEINGGHGAGQNNVPANEARRGRNLFACPSGFYEGGNWKTVTSLPGLARSGWLPIHKSGAGGGFILDYTINGFGGLTTGFRGIADSEVLYLVEAKREEYNWSMMRIAGSKLRNDPLRQLAWRSRIPHHQTSNYSAWDGHVASMRIERYMEIEWEWWTQPPNFLPVRFDPKW